MNQKLMKWTALASHYIGDQFDNCKPFLDRDYQGLHPTIRFVTTQLYLSCHFSTQSSITLLKEGLEWDADIINRSIAEGTIKYAYMLQGSEADMLEKVGEYWEILPDFSAVKRSQRAHSFLLAADGYGKKEWKAIEDLALNDEEIEKLRRDSNRLARKQVEQKWSFNAILSGFVKSEDKKLSSLAHLAYGYGMSSHLIHKDGDGVAMIWERCARDLERQNAVKLGHIARSISDLCTFTDIRSLILTDCCQEDRGFISDLKETYAELFEDLQQAAEYFNEVEYGDSD